VLSIPSHAVRTCEGLSRRDWLRIGGLGSLGLNLPNLLEARTTHSGGGNRAASFGRAKSCIVLFMFGAPAHQDIWDLKPEAPAEIRGEFRPISSNVPGITVCQHIPQLAQMVDRFAQIRSVTHPDDTHTVAMHYMLTGVRHKRPKTNPRNAPDDFPCFGAVANYLSRKESASAERNTPASRNVVRSAFGGAYAAVSLNAPANQVKANNHIFPGFFAGFLGGAHDPLFVSQRANDKHLQPLPNVENPSRLLKRRDLLASLDRQSRLIDQSAEAANFDGHFNQAVRLLTSSQARKAFRIHDEPDRLRARYGTTPFGQGCLLARRLVEAGVCLVTVNWDRDDAYWDTHADNFNKHKKLLLPNMDRGFSALLEDLEARGLLDETLIVWLAEFGRTPRINSSAGRDHWAACNTVLLAGAGIEGGQVYGASDRHAAYPALNPVRPEDLAATIYHLLGIDPKTTLRTPAGQPLPLSQGETIAALL
jgi:hypothetical protein